MVGIRVQPLSTLVKFPFLKLALQRSLVHYMEEQGETSGDPARWKRAWRTSPTMKRSLPRCGITCMACILAITCFVLFPNFSLILAIPER